MKKILLFLLLLPFVSIAQTANGTETKQNAFRSLNPQTVTSVNYLTTMGTDGTMGRVNPNNLSFAQADTGVLTFAGMTTNTATTINIGAVTGQIVDNTTNPLSPVKIPVIYPGATGVTVTTVGSGTASYVMLSSAGVISFQNTFPTSAEKKTKIWLGKVSHPAGAVTLVFNEPDNALNPQALVRDWIQDLGPYINNGVFPYANGANLNINVTGGTITGNGINFVTDKTNPNHIEALPASVANFFYRTQNGGATAAVNLISPGFYDNAGTITAIGGGAGASTIQHVEYIPGQGYIVQLGQQVYATFNDAVAAVGRENPSFVRWSNLVNNAIPIGVIVVNKTATALNNPVQALFFKANKTGDFFGAQAGVATGTLQTSYLNSVVPQIVTTAGLGSLTIKRGSAADTDNILVGQNGAGVNTSELKGNGGLSISNSFNMNNIATPAFMPTVTINGAGLLTGAYSWSVSYYTSDGKETGVPDATAVYNLSSQKVDLSNIPVSPSPLVIGRRIYRTDPALGDQKAMRLVVDIPNNTTTFFQDNVPDSSLGTLPKWYNSTGGEILINGSRVFSIMGQSFVIGNGATAGTGYANHLVGNNAGANITSGYRNTLNGLYAGANLTTGFENTATGIHSLNDNLSGHSNSTYGYDSLSHNTIGSDNAIFGTYAFSQNINGSRNIGIGLGAGSNDMGSDKFYVNNKRYSTLDDDIARSIMYGNMNENPSVQNLRINAKVGIGGEPDSYYALAVKGTGIAVATEWATTGGTSYKNQDIYMPFGGSFSFNSGVDPDVIPEISALYNSDGDWIFEKNVFMAGTFGLNSSPTTSAGAYDLLTRNASTGIIEKVSSTAYASTVSPALTGTPTAPTATLGTNTTQIATTAFVQNALSAGKSVIGTYTVSTLPTPSGTAYAIVTDATAPTYLGALTGGGSVVCPVFYNGTIWVSH